MRFLCGLAFVVAVLVITTAQAPYTNGVVKIGVLTDMSSVCSDVGGSCSIAAAKSAVDDFSPAAHGVGHLLTHNTLLEQQTGRARRRRF